MIYDAQLEWQFVISGYYEERMFAMHTLLIIIEESYREDRRIIWYNAGVFR